MTISLSGNEDESLNCVVTQLSDDGHIFYDYELARQEDIMLASAVYASCEGDNEITKKRLENS